MRQAFIIRAFDTKKDSSGKEIDFERIHRELIAPALAALGLGGGTTGEIIEAGNIREDMFGLIVEADLVVCDITVHNANVFYELGIRHALRKKRSVLIKGGPVADSTPFDILTDRYLPYVTDDPAKAKDDLEKVIRATLASERTDSPIFKMLPTLPEADPAAVQVVPQDFTEEVARAAAARSPGWLRLLASEVAGRRFQWPALRLIAQAQWDLTDFEGSRRSWERIRANDPDDIAANLALANLYERDYRREGKAQLLEESNLAIARVLRSDKATAGQRAEALALEGRNLKTLWRLDFEGLDDLGARRETATNRTLLKAYEAYRKAYLVDLNHHWSGLAALQQGTVALDLSGAEDVWQDAFDNADRAAAYRGELGRQVEALRPMVSQAIEAALARLPPGHPDRVWAEISAADLMFLVEDRPRRVLQAYRDAVPNGGLFAWNAAKGQLALYAKLGIKAELAGEIIRTLDARLAPPAARDAPPAGDTRPHLVIFAGHRLDEPGRAEPRFPREAEPKARELIREALQQVQAKAGGSPVEVLASAAPGSDVLCHEVCRELGIGSSVCLPMPKDAFARLAFGDLDSWRSRYLELVGLRPVLQLSDQEGLPRWLQGAAGVDPWERGNRWVLEVARTRGAAKVTLVALWDGKATGDAPGGTAHMVRIAQDAGTVEIVRIDAARLLT